MRSTCSRLYRRPGLPARSRVCALAAVLRWTFNGNPERSLRPRFVVTTEAAAKSGMDKKRYKHTGNLPVRCGSVRRYRSQTEPEIDDLPKQERCKLLQVAAPGQPLMRGAGRLIIHMFDTGLLQRFMKCLNTGVNAFRFG